jgi:hypothetical protein
VSTLAHVRKIALKLEGAVVDEAPRFGVRVNDRPFLWTWRERVQPKKPRVFNEKVLAMRTADLDEKEALLSLSEEKFFTEPHYNGYPAVLIRLEKVRVPELRALLTEAHRTLTAKRPRAKSASRR